MLGVFYCSEKGQATQRDGPTGLPRRFLGYDRDQDGNLVINEGQAETVRRIYGFFLQCARLMWLQGC